MYTKVTFKNFSPGIEFYFLLLLPSVLTVQLILTYGRQSWRALPSLGKTASNRIRRRLIFSTILWLYVFLKLREQKSRFDVPYITHSGGWLLAPLTFPNVTPSLRTGSRLGLVWAKYGLGGAGQAESSLVRRGCAWEPVDIRLMPPFHDTSS